MAAPLAFQHRQPLRHRLQDQGVTHQSQGCLPCAAASPTHLAASPGGSVHRCLASNVRGLLQIQKFLSMRVPPARFRAALLDGGLSVTDALVA